MTRFLKTNKILLLFSIILAIIPFFWLKPGEMDLGGDSSRLYFYDPLSYLSNTALYGVVPQGFGQVEPNYYFLPFIILLVILKKLISSPYVLISLFNSLKLVGGFVFIYLIVKELVFGKSKKNNFTLELSALLSGLFYTFTSGMIWNWSKALMSHNQVFLNPLMFYLLLKFLISNNYKYIWGILAVSLIFAPNFALTSAPPFFAFYPLAFLFILLYISIVLKKKILWKNIAIGLFLFLGIQSFQLIPQFISLLDPGSFANTRVFSKESIVHEGVRYFLAVLPLAKVSVNILLPSPIAQLKWVSVIFPLIIILGFLINRGKDKTVLLTGFFFLITFFLLTANVTGIGVEFYKKLFYIPGFSMFRNFIGQWSFVYSFFYSLLLGQAVYIVFKHIPIRHAVFSAIFLTLILVGGAWPFVNGSLVNTIHPGSNNVRIAMRFDTDYVNTLSFIKSLKDESKMLTLPFSDSYYQVIAGANGGAYIGPSTISYLSGKNDFSGYQVMTAPFSEEFMKLSREKNYEEIKKLLGILNIGYIFHNSDPRIYDTVFPGSPYDYVRKSLPNTQKEYSQFIDRLGGDLIYQKGPYKIYSLKGKEFLPLFYTTNDSNISKNLRSPKISYKKINPTEYEIKVFKSEGPYVLVFQDSFHRKWELFINSEKNRIESKHFVANEYSNVWDISSGDVGNLKNYTLILKMTGQKAFNLSLLISLIFLAGLIIWGIRLFKINRLLL